MTDPAFGALFGLVLFGTVPGVSTLIGMVVVAIAGVALAREQRAPQRATA